MLLWQDAAMMQRFERAATTPGAASTMSEAPTTSNHEAQVTQLIQEIMTQTLLYRPEKPLEFIVQYLDEICDGANPLVHSYHMLQLTHRNPEQFLDELAKAYSALSARRGTPYALGEDVSRLVRALSVDLPQKYEDAILAAVDAVCAAGKPVEFERFGGCVRVAITTRFLVREARELWHALEPRAGNKNIQDDFNVHVFARFRHTLLERNSPRENDSSENR